jgi:alpha-D-xyloside xylohydrolase
MAQFQIPAPFMKLASGERLCHGSATMEGILRLLAPLAMAVAAAFLSGELVAQPPSAVPIAHGMVVTTKSGDKVRVLAFRDGTFRVTVAADPAQAAKSFMVVAKPDGTPKFSQTGGTATLTTPRSRADVRLSDGRLRVFNRASKLLLDEYAPARRLAPETIEGHRFVATRVQFNRGTNEGLFGLGQHQNRQMNYNGEDVELAQHNMDIAVPYLLSTRGYGILWDNNSITRIGDPKPYEMLHAAGGWQADYYLGDTVAARRVEATIDYPYIRDLKRWPAEARVDKTTKVVWNGTYTPDKTGNHKFRLYSSSYVEVYADGTKVLDRWRQNWNPWYHNFELSLTKGKPVRLRIEWQPNQGYIALYHADPLPPQDRHSVSFASEASKTIDYYVVPGANMDALVAGYRRLTGKAPMMPRWAYGFWQSRQRYETQDQLVGVLRQYREQHIPIDNVVQDWFYWPEDQWGCQCFDPKRFPDPQGMVDAVHALHGQVMISVWPKFYPGTANGKELAAKGYLLQRPLDTTQRDWVGPGYANTYYDPYSPEARAIYFRQIRNGLVSKGFDAWWMDATEPDWHSNLSIEERKYQMYSPAAGLPGAAIFNSYPLVHALGMAEGLRAAQPDKRPFILTRSGFGGTQRASAAVWSGDVAARWSNLRDQISAGANLSLSGIPNGTHDIGGFSVEDRYSKQDPAALPEWRELYLRWFQFGAFSPLFRSHGEFPYREIPLVSAGDPAMREALIHYDRLRYRLLPYIYTLAARTWFDDGTIMRPLVMDFAADRRAWNVDDEYLFGPALLVAPVTEFRARERRVYLPSGADWYEESSGRRLAGGQEYTAAAPRERMPLFVRAGSIVPLGPEVEWTGENPQGPLTIHVFPGADGTFALYEDQGTDMGYTRGQFARIPFRWDEKTRRLTIGGRQGSFPGMARTRRIGVVVHGDGGGPMFERQPERWLTYSGSAITLEL